MLSFHFHPSLLPSPFSPPKVRDLLRGAPDTSVTVSFERPGAPPDKDSQGITLTLTRRLVRVPDVKLTTFLGPVEDGIGYVQLQGRRNRGERVRQRKWGRRYRSTMEIRPSDHPKRRGCRKRACPPPFPCHHPIPCLPCVERLDRLLTV